LGLSITKRRRRSWSEPATTLSELVNEKRGISPEMAVRLSKVFGRQAPKSWLVQPKRSTILAQVSRQSDES